MFFASVNLFAINLIPQQSRSSERHHLSWLQHHILTSSRITAFPRLLSFTQNLPNPLTKTSSPDARVALMISRRDSVTSMEAFLGNPSFVWTCSTTSCFVSAILKSLVFRGLWREIRMPYIWQIFVKLSTN